MEWSVIEIGKYRGRGKILPQVVFDDPDWFFWACDRGVFRDNLAAQAEHVRRRARRVRVPRADGERLVAEYVVGDRTGALVGVSLVPADPGYPRWEGGDRRPWIDLGYG